MLVEKKTLIFSISAMASSIGVIACGIYKALQNSDSHYFNKFGSILVVISLLLVVYQFLYEADALRREEDLRRRLLAVPFYPNRPRLSLILDRGRAVGSVESLIWRSRLVVLGSSVFIGIIGELVHGFGDDALDALLNALRAIIPIVGGAQHTDAGASSWRG